MSSAPRFAYPRPSWRNARAFAPIASVVDYTGEWLMWRHASGREEKFPGARVQVQVDPPDPLGLSGIVLRIALTVVATVLVTRRARAALAGRLA